MSLIISIFISSLGNTCIFGSYSKVLKLYSLKVFRSLILMMIAIIKNLSEISHLLEFYAAGLIKPITVIMQ